MRPPDFGSAPAMQLDALTLMTAGSFLAGVGAVLLFGASLQMRPANAIRWWVIGYALNAVSVAVLASGFALQNPLTIAIGSGAVPFGFAAIWAGTRAFRGRPAPWWFLVAIPLVRVAAGLLPFPEGPAASGTIVTFALAAAFLAAACTELWLGRAEHLGARWPLIGVMALHAAIYAGGVVDVVLDNLPLNTVPPIASWFGLIYFEQMVFLLGSAVFVVMMSRERQEATFIAAARVDSLTGAANRGAFFIQADRVWQRAREAGSPLALIAFDLDHFKAVNDSRGHLAGDEVLRAFASSAGAVLRPGDLFGRVGDEEFAALLPGVGTEAAYVIADRVRHAFEAAPKLVAGIPVQATVSAGVAEGGPDLTLEAIMVAADEALYRAKASGRNRVERAEPHSAVASNIIRIA